jgi:hypothetical protein
MNHLPFKEWLLSEEPLTQEQNQVFQEHLRGCVECQQAQASWSEVNNLFQRTTQMAPAAGFTNRWQNRLAVRRAKRQRLQLGLALIGGVVLALVLILLVSTQLFPLFQSPTQFVLMCLAQLASLFVLFSSLQTYLTVFFKSFPLIPILGLVLSVGFISLISVLWLTTYQQLVIARRFAK